MYALPTMTPASTATTPATTSKHHLFVSAAAVIAFLAVLFVFLAPVAASATPQCGPHDRITEVLTKKYQEKPSAFGVTNNGQLVEVYTTGEGSTWTILITSPDGVTCFVSAGEGWRNKVQVAEGPAV